MNAGHPRNVTAAHSREFTRVTLVPLCGRRVRTGLFVPARTAAPPRLVDQQDFGQGLSKAERHRRTAHRRNATSPRRKRARHSDLMACANAAAPPVSPSTPAPPADRVSCTVTAAAARRCSGYGWGAPSRPPAHRDAAPRPPSSESLRRTRTAPPTRRCLRVEPRARRAPSGGQPGGGCVRGIS